MTSQEKLNLVTNYFSEDWAIEKAMQLLEDYDKAQQPTQPLAPTDDEIDAVVQACRERGLRELDVFRAVLAKWGAPRSLEEHIHQVFAIHGIKGGQHGTE